MHADEPTSDATPDTTPTVDEALVTMSLLADAAGPVMRAGLGRPARTKDDGTPVTDDDTALNDLVVDTVAARHPRCAVVGEERSRLHVGGREAALRAGGTFVVDPIDGTVAYTVGLGVAAFAMAYLHDGELAAAVVDDPFGGQRFSAVRGRGTTLNGTPVHVGDAPRSNQVHFEAPAHSLRPDWSADLALRGAGFLLTRFRAFIGPAARVASGSLTGAVFPRASLHDCASIALLVAEAGGTVTDLSGRPWDPETHDGLVVAHPDAHAALLELVAQARA